MLGSAAVPRSFFRKGPAGTPGGGRGDGKEKRLKEEWTPREIGDALLRWYDENARQMPWRGIRDPYGTWVSEIMLQQTRVETVRDYYVRFLERFPTLRDLAEAPEEDVLKMWEGLGYYSRARNLHQGARQVMRDFGGEIPREPEKLRTVRGIGPYTSCAIASIAWDVPVAAVDGNVIRVICRLYGLEGNPAEAAAHARIEQLAGALVPPDRAGDHNQAMMDLGATVCVPGTPDCDRCPLRAACEARDRGTAESLPRLPKAKPPREIVYDLPVLLAGENVLLRQRTEKLLRGLWCFPLIEGAREAEELAEYLRRWMRLPAEALCPEGTARHVFTHQVWRMNLWRAAVRPGAPAPEGYAWIPLEKVPELAMPTAMKAAREILKKQGV